MSEKEQSDTSPAAKKRTWLGKLGIFLMYGGWILVAILILGITVAIYTC